MNAPLNLPNNILEMVKRSNNILFLGVGGGFDIMGSIPLYVNLDVAKKITFANYNPRLKAMEKFDTRDLPAESDHNAHIEHKLAEWLAPHELGQTVYGIPKGGVKSTAAYLKKIVKDHDIDMMILVDGGVDSLMNGDEEGAGTWLDDTVTMLAASEAGYGMHKVLACLGFGTELEEGLCHHHVLKNMSSLLADEAFWGCCALIRDSWEFRQYRDACEYVWENYRKSHIHTKVISAVDGLFGDTNLYEGVDAQVLDGVKCKNYISPLMSLYWFFALDWVLLKNKMAKLLKDTNTSTDVMMLYRQNIDQLNTNKRKREAIPY